MNEPITYKGIPMVFNGPYCKTCGTEMKRDHTEDKFDCPLCRANAEINRLKAIILDRNEAIEVFQDIVETNKEKLSAMSYALTIAGQAFVSISAHAVNCVNKIEDVRKMQ